MSVDRPLGEYWPTTAWMERYRAALNDSEDYGDAAAGWGVDFDGDYVFEITDVPVDDRSFGELPDELVGATATALEGLESNRFEAVLAGAPDGLADRVAPAGAPRSALVAELEGTRLAALPDLVWPELRDVLPPTVVGILDEQAQVTDDGTVYAYLALEDGACHEVDSLQSPDEREHGMVLTGTYESWKKLTTGEGQVVGMIMGGELDLTGDMQKVLRYTDAATAMTDVAVDLESRYLF